MRQSTSSTLTSESGQWNNRSSNVATTPKKIPPKTANSKANRKSFQGSNKRERELIHLGQRTSQLRRRFPSSRHATTQPMFPLQLLSLRGNAKKLARRPSSDAIANKKQCGHSWPYCVPSLGYVLGNSKIVKLILAVGTLPKLRIPGRLELKARELVDFRQLDPVRRR